MTTKVYYPPEKIQPSNNISIFLAGTIDNGDSIDWQQYVIDKLSDRDIDIYNPRRKDWDSTWVTDFESPQFFQQVSWEIDAMEKADVIFMVFKNGSKSPISLLELGLMSKDKTMYVVCEPGFYRKGNVDFVCNKFSIPTFDTIDEMLDCYIC